VNTVGDAGDARTSSSSLMATRRARFFASVSDDLTDSRIESMSAWCLGNTVSTCVAFRGFARMSEMSSTWTKKQSTQVIRPHS
jgi:hypothetical protein